MEEVTPAAVGEQPGSLGTCQKEVTTVAQLYACVTACASQEEPGSFADPIVFGPA